jgi:Ran GTPase-activating protein (RanGAP) involved in mRNA processing and transport
MISNIERKILHVKARPTYTNINTLFMLIKKLNIGDQKIPRLESTNLEGIKHYCEQIENIIKNSPDILPAESEEYSDSYRFTESNFLPKNNESDDDMTNDDTDESNESGSSESSEKDETEEQEEDIGYEFYEEDDDEAEFSD